MGIARRAVEGRQQLAIAAFDEAVLFEDAPLLAPSYPEKPGEFRHLLVPRAVFFTGDIDAHDLVWIGGELYAANTRFSCISRLDARFSFIPAWVPPFVTKVMPEDRCHLNGLAADDKTIHYATAFAVSDAPRGWSEQRGTGGVLFETPSGKPLVERLCVPHSPRLFEDKLFVLESGTGRVLGVERTSGETRVLAELPGFTRGFDRYGDILFVGLSNLRPGRRETKLPIEEFGRDIWCGIAAIDRKEGRLIGWLRFTTHHEEIFDVKAVPNFQLAGMVHPYEDVNGRALVLPGRAFWAEELRAEKAPPPRPSGNPKK